MIDTALIADALAGYDPNASEDDVAAAERQRADFLEMFPKGGVARDDRSTATRSGRRITRTTSAAGWSSSLPSSEA